MKYLHAIDAPHWMVEAMCDRSPKSHDNALWGRGDFPNSPPPPAPTPGLAKPTRTPYRPPAKTSYQPRHHNLDLVYGIDDPVTEFCDLCGMVVEDRQCDACGYRIQGISLQPW